MTMLQTKTAANFDSQTVWPGVNLGILRGMNNIQNLLTTSPRHLSPPPPISPIRLI